MTTYEGTDTRKRIWVSEYGWEASVVGADGINRATSIWMVLVLGLLARTRKQRAILGHRLR